ncbi:hypothetical protein SO802_000274 [Lithocarpus litseifolius]|uniref:RNase H type-1 domain-containing protein n=1 Tax=Lithocarpus litseifolius TaxID=425828 RepID=A0AAW2DV54_9ROSI
MRVHDHNLTNCADIVKLILDSPIPLAQEVDREHIITNLAFTLDEIWHLRNHIITNLAFTLDEIWHLRNQLIFEDTEIDILSSSNRISRRVHEFSNLHNLDEHAHPSASPTSWSPPPVGTIKLNVDAAVDPTSTALAVLARDHTGVPIKIWMKKHICCLPVQAEVASVLWAINLASAEGWTRIIIEGDSKICFDALSTKNSMPPWNISHIVSDVLSASKSFISVYFIWVRRVCNTAAHEAARFALHSPVSISFSLDSLPLVLAIACKADFPPCSSLF